MSLKEYNKKRHFNKTFEPAGKVGKKGSQIFVIQKHHASHLHYDFRLEVNGVLKSWAVPKEPPREPKEKRLAVEVEDHPVSYAKFKGEIPQGEYGAGVVEIWDQGTWHCEEDPMMQLKKGRLDFELRGKKMQGRWLLIRTKTGGKKPNWLLIKHSDEDAVKTTKSTKLAARNSKVSKLKIAKELPAFIEPELCSLSYETRRRKKCIHMQEFVIGGFTYQKERKVIGALLVGEYDKEGKFIYVGRLGTGFSKSNIPKLTKKLKTLKVKDSPFSKKVPHSKSVHWVKPELVAHAEFAAWTEDHILRHATFKGLREDKPANEVVEDLSSRAPSPVEAKSEDLSSVRITHPEKIIFSKDEITKLDIINYYKQIEDFILPHIKNRPMALLRCPTGQGQSCFFQKHLDQSEDYIHVNSLNELLELVQINSLEIHTWNSKLSDIEKPDQIVFDLDPDPTVSWADVKQGASHLKEILDQLGLKSFLKVSGNKGLHIHVPIRPLYNWDEIKNFSLSVCNELVDQFPTMYTVDILKKDRKNKIFLDYLRNAQGATAAAAYSLRNNPNASVALPIEWEELKKLKGASTFSMKDVLRRLKREKDPWENYYNLNQSIRLLDISRHALGPRI